MHTTRFDVLVIGGSLGGAAAALAAGRAGARVCFAFEESWFGGQLTIQGVCTPDENAWVEWGGATASYQELRRRIREHYRTSARLSAEGAAQQYLNPGSCWVSRLSAEPGVAWGELRTMLQALPGVDGRPCVEERPRTRAVDVDVDGDRIAGVLVAGSDGTRERIEAPMVLDATDLGDLLPLAGVEHVVGAECRADTGEPDAPDRAHPEWVQPFTFPFALEFRPEGEDHTIEPPPDYEELKGLQRYHILDGAMRGMFGELGWWTYRRVIAARNFADALFPCDVAMINTGSNDYKGAVVPTPSRETDAATLAAGRRASLGYLYWLQTECPRVDDPSRRGYPEMKLRGDWFGTSDGVSVAPYIRESRRIVALRTVTEQEVVAADASGTPCQRGPRAAFFGDSCGVGHYWLDIHDGPAGESGRFLETRPFQVPLGALIPVRVTNLLAACKNLGVTHLTNGAYRLHPIEWNVGEAAGALAAYCVAHQVEPHAVWASPERLADIQGGLVSAGVPLYWWADLPPEHQAFPAAQKLAMGRVWPDGETLDFRPDEPLTDGDAAEIAAKLPAGALPPRAGTARGQAALDLLCRIGWS